MYMRKCKLSERNYESTCSYYASLCGSCCAFWLYGNTYNTPPTIIQFCCAQTQNLSDTLSSVSKMCGFIAWKWIRSAFMFQKNCFPPVGMFRFTSSGAVAHVHKLSWWFKLKPVLNLKLQVWREPQNHPMHFPQECVSFGHIKCIS